LASEFSCHCAGRVQEEVEEEQEEEEEEELYPFHEKNNFLAGIEYFLTLYALAYLRGNHQ
jgi:hypothetical protein